MIDGKELVPHDPLFFVQDILHPNDLGMVCYAKHLAQEIKKHLA